MNRLTTLLLLAIATLSLIAAPRNKNNILTIKENITDNDIVFPESFETDTHELMKNWYLQNYTVLDADVESRDFGEVSDAEYIKRLKAMPTVIEMPYNQVVRSYIERYITRNRTLVEEMLGMSLYYMPIFEQALEREGLPLELKYLPVIESALDPNAVSRAGAAGLWQFMVGTGKGLGLEVNTLVDERRDPYKSSEKAAAFLKDLFSIYGDWSLAIAAYNCGPGNVNKALRRAGGENKDFWEIYDYLPRETRGYVPAFIAANYVMTYFKRHNISASLASKPLITDTVGITRRVHFNQISQVLNMSIDELRALNPQYRHDVIPGSDEHCYTLVLPSQQVYSYIMSEDSIAAYRPDIYAQRGTVEPGGSGESVDEDGHSTEPKTETHKVRRGETYTSIAAQYGMELNELLALNGLSGGKARRGQTLKVQNRKAQRAAYDTDEYDGIRVVRHDENGNELAQNDPEQENEQIEEVRQVEQAAQDSRTHRQQVDTPVQPKAQPAAPAHQPGHSQQSHKRNERYADNQKSRHSSRESTYKHSHSSSSKDEAKQRRHNRKTQAKPTEYNVKKGETLSEISERTGVPVATIKEANGLKDDNIRAGSNLKLTTPQTTKGKKGGKGAKADKAGKGGKGSKGGKAAKAAKGGGKTAKAGNKGKGAAKSGGKSAGSSKSKGKKRR